MTVEDDIRKNYNSSKLINETHSYNEDLPELPAKLQTETTNSPDKPNNLHTQVNKQTTSNRIKTIKIKKGTSLNVTNSVKISDWQKRGTKIKFTNRQPIYGKKYTIPTSTVFFGEIIEVHQPQFSCNGGLVVIRIRSMNYKGENIPLNAYITKANDKLIFFNDIKGERKYLKTVWKKGSWGRTLFNKMFALTVNLGSDCSTFILSPFPILYGSLCFGANTLISPITAFFSKGGHVSIPAGSSFKIKLLEDTYID